MLLTVFLILSLLIAVSFHEAAHAFVADRLGDSTAKMNGRLTLNPLAHLDPIGTLALIFIHIGWGKPVPVDLRNLRHPSRDNFLIALSGPAVNLALALISAVILHFFAKFQIVNDFFSTFIALNIILMLFNLLPIPPLDGSKIWHLILSDENYYALEQMGPFILLSVLVLSYSAGGFIFNFIGSLSDKIISLIT